MNDDIVSINDEIKKNGNFIKQVTGFNMYVFNALSESGDVSGMNGDIPVPLSLYVVNFSIILLVLLCSK